MTRDANLLRQILLDLEAGQASATVTDPDETMLAHYQLLEEAGYLELENASTTRQVRVLVKRITWKGYEFLEAVKSEAVWRAILDRFGSAVPIGIIHEVAWSILIAKGKETPIEVT